MIASANVKPSSIQLEGTFNASEAAPRLYGSTEERHGQLLLTGYSLELHYLFRMSIISISGLYVAKSATTVSVAAVSK